MKQGKRFLPWLGVSLALLVGIAVWFIQPLRPSSLARLAAATPGDARLIEARISGGFQWAPFPGSKRRETGTRTLSMLAAAHQILQSTEERSPHAAAVAQLFADHSDVAIAELTAIAQESREAAVWNDLGAAHYDAAARSGSAEHLMDALAAVDQALLFDPGFSEALFNRALVLERFHLRDAAASAWRDFLAHAPSDGWRDEAQRHLDVLTAPRQTFATEIKSHYPRLQAGDRAAARNLLRLDAGDARYFGETEGLARWGEAWLKRDAGAGQHLEAVKTLAAELVAFNGEALLLDSVATIERATERERRALARGHVTYRDGRLAYVERDFAEAEQLLQAAVRDLTPGSSPLASMARLDAAAAMFWQGRHSEAESEFRALQPAAPAKYAALRATIDWRFAVCSLARADTGKSLSHLSRAIEAFSRLGEASHAAYLHNITSQAYDGVRDHQRAAHHRALALRVLGPTSNDRLVHAINGISHAAVQLKQWRRARSFVTVQLTLNAATVNDAELQISALLRRALLHTHLGDRAAAASDLRTAQAVTASVSDPAHRTKLQIDCDTTTALISDDPRTAIALLTAALEFQAAKGWHGLMPQMYLRRGRMYLALHDRERAASDFESGIALMEKYRETIELGEQRWGMLDAAEELFDEAIREALRGGAAPAFAYAERRRARSLSDTIKNARVFDHTLLPPETLVVEYAALPEKLLIFTVSRTGIEVRETAVSQTQLTALAEQFAAAHGEADPRERAKLATRLGERLLAPIRTSIAAHREVAFVTDASTSGIAFAALPGIAPERMLVEDVTISVSPSARFYLAARRRGARKGTSVLIVDSPENERLRRLTRTSREAQAVQAVYPYARRLTGHDATRAAFIEESRTATIIHFAGHGVSGVESATLILTATPDDSGLFDAQSISRLDLRKTEVVVLAACDTARGPVRSAEGVTSVTHAFLQAGVPAVIATLRPLDDRDAADFFPRMHRHLARGVSAPEALRLAQLEWIANAPRDRTAVWAAVQAIGY